MTYHPVGVVRVGMRVVVPFGKGRRLYTGVVRTSRASALARHASDEVLDQVPIVDRTQLRLWEMRGRSLPGTLGEVMVAALLGNWC